MRTLRTQPPGKPMAVETPFTDTEAIQRLQMIAPRLGKFAHDLVIAADKGWLTHNRLVWVHKLVVDATVPSAAKPQQPPETLDVSGVYKMLSFAIARGARPKLTFATRSNGRIRLQVAGDRSKYPGSINVSDGLPFGQGTFYGNIRDGKLHPTDKCSDSVKRFLSILSEYPAGVIGLYGRIMSSCMFCRRDLTDARSITVGYGKVCSENHNLPWGDKAPFLPSSVESEVRAFLVSDVADEIEDEIYENGFGQ